MASPSEPGPAGSAPDEAARTDPDNAGATDAAPSPRRWLALPTLAGLLIGGVCGLFVVRALIVQWGDVRDDIASASPLWLAAALVLAAAAMLWVAATWADALAAVGFDADRRRTVAWFFAGEIGKYVPGGVWSVLGRGEMARRGGVPAERAYPSVALSLATLYLSALAVAAVLVPLDLANQADSPAALALLALLPLGLAVLSPRLLLPVRRLLHRYTGKGAGIAIPPWRATVGLVVRYVPAWLLTAAATWCVARALMPEPSLLRVGIATTLSWTAGLLAVPVPAGAGVREAVFMAASGMAAGPAATVAVASRLVFLFVDVGGAAATAPWHRRRAGPSPVAGTAVHDTAAPGTAAPGTAAPDTASSAAVADTAASGAVAQRSASTERMSEP